MTEIYCGCGASRLEDIMCADCGEYYRMRWIPVSRPPAEKQRVIILLKNGDVSNTVFEDGEFMWDEGIPYRPGAVRGWLPMPTEVE